MHRICCHAACTFYLFAASTLLLHPADAATIDIKASPTRGIAVLASTIGHQYTPEALAELVQQGKFSPVVVDWAWITYHWDRTDFAAVKRFLDLMAARKVPVVAMYRPRFLSNPTVPTQMDQDGRRGTDHVEICYSDASARKWGLSWGEKILDKCPGFREIIIYNPSNSCHCPECTAASKSNRYSLIVHFLAGAKTAWKAKQPGVKLGVVAMTDPAIWRASLQTIDVAHPYLLIREGVDPAKDVEGIVAVRSIVKNKMGACLGKITWEEGAQVPVEQLRTIDALARKSDLSYFFWTFDTLFDSSLYDTKAVAQMVGMDPSSVEKLTGTKPAGDDSAIKPTDAQRASAKALIEQIMQAAPGKPKFDAIDAVVKKAKESDAAERKAILQLCISTMRDRNAAIIDRWPLCYAISRSGYEPGVPDLIELLRKDQVEIIRAVAAEALADFTGNRAARDALLQAACKETSQTVRDVLTRRLGKDMPTCSLGSLSTPSSGDAAQMPNPAQRESAEALLKQIRDAKPGADMFQAIESVAKNAREGDAATRQAVVALCVSTMNDKSLDIPLRWPCCYVLSGIGDQQGLAKLIPVLLNDESEVIRGVAAEALGMAGTQEGLDALTRAARKEPAKSVRDTIARYLGQSMPALEPGHEPVEGKAVKELAPTGPPKPPAGPAKPVDKPLPWPFAGDYKAQKVFNNYQTMPDGYIHAGLDFIHPLGTPVKAVASGYVAYIRSTPPHTHDTFIVATEKDGSKGWCYTHMDPATFTFKEGDKIEQGQVLGKLVEFAVNGQRGADHLHIQYVTFSKDPSGDVTIHSLLDPLYFFDWKDTVAPSFKPLYFVPEGTMKQFEADSSGVVTVNGEVDILAAISDVAYKDQQALYGVPVVMLSISDGTHTTQKLVLDHRGAFDDERQTGPLYLSRDDGKKLIKADSWFPYYQALRVTKTDGDGKIEPADSKECWDTTAKDSDGKPAWPNGRYSVNVYAWDIAGNRGAAGAVVEVKN